MTPFELIAQAVGIAAMAFNILSFQQKTQKSVIGFQLFGSILFAVNFFMLNAPVGGILNLVGALRAIVFMNREKFRADHCAWLIFFTTLYVSSYILTFTVFQKELTPVAGIIELLPVIAMTVTTISFRMQSAKSIRKFGLISSPSWLIYNIANFAVGAIICEVLSLGSIVIGLIRYDLKPRKGSATRP